MSDITKVRINGTIYDIKDTEARTDLLAKVNDAPTDGEEYVRKNGQWAISSTAGIALTDDTAVIRPDGSVIGNSILLEDGSAIILTSDETASGFYYIAENFSNSKSYAAGEIVIYDGILYRFIVNHAAGDWNSSEVVITTIKSELASIKSELAASEVGSLTNNSAFNGTIYYRRYMGIFTVWGNITVKTSLTTGSLALGYIPEGYRPTLQTHASAAGYINFGKNVSTAPMILESNGKITIKGNGSDGLVKDTQPIIFSFTYF